ncbi:MAG: signal peptidase I [Opitutae bacterium]|nr:signal peptidase I [Opitutae bacterium]
MFSIFKQKKHKKLRERADNWLRLAEKIYHFRRDQMSDGELRELKETSVVLHRALREKGEVDWGKVRMASEQLENVLKQVGGSFYPQTFWAENAEMFLVASIVALAIRTFFLQPFKIPTNSMYPTYNGVTHEVITSGNNQGYGTKIFRFLASGAVRREVVAQDSGELIIPLAGRSERLVGQRVPGRKWLVFPTTNVRYSLIVGDEPVHFKVPADFKPTHLNKETFFPEEQGDWPEIVQRFNQEGRIRYEGRYGWFLKTGKTFQAGEQVMAFDILTGDALFVDRLSYHFVRPDVGEAIVFKTKNIPATNDDKYYIKRLVGAPGDELQVIAPKLYRNGALITGAEAFEKNAALEGNYSGYSYKRLTSRHYLNHPEATVTIPENKFFAMGDNSPHSSDSRYWGFVPKEEMVGKALFIYYPFTLRWGLAR